MDIIYESLLDAVTDEKAAAIARTYANALLNIASEQGQADAVVSELWEMLLDFRQVNPQFLELFRSPVISLTDKDRIIQNVLVGRASETLVNFLRVMNRRGRLGLVPEVAVEARRLWNDRSHRVEVVITSAHPLDEDQLSRLHEEIGRLTHETPLIQLKIDPSLIGGLIIKIRDFVYDVSVRNQLKRVHTRLLEQRSHEIQNRRDHFSHTA